LLNAKSNEDYYVNKIKYIYPYKHIDWSVDSFVTNGSSAARCNRQRAVRVNRVTAMDKKCYTISID
jgi:hypothetical protein